MSRVPRSPPSTSRAESDEMNRQPKRLSTLVKLSLAATAAGVLGCLPLFVRETAYTLVLFMFIGQPLLVTDSCCSPGRSFATFAARSCSKRAWEHRAPVEGGSSRAELGLPAPRHESQRDDVRFCLSRPALSRPARIVRAFAFGIRARPEARRDPAGLRSDRSDWRKAGAAPEERGGRALGVDRHLHSPRLHRPVPRRAHRHLVRLSQRNL